MITCLDIGGSGIKGAVACKSSRDTPVGASTDAAGRFRAHSLPPSARCSLYRLAPPGSARCDRYHRRHRSGTTGIITCANIPCIDRPAACGRAEPSGSVARWSSANDADLFRAGRSRRRAPGSGHSIVFGAILGTGVGGGLVIDGHIVSGPGGFRRRVGPWPDGRDSAGRPAAVEHPAFCLRLRPDRLRRYPGRRRAALERLHKHLHGVDLPSTVEIVEAVEAGDAAASTHDRALHVDRRRLLALVVNVVGAGIVPVGGGLGKSPELIVRSIGGCASILRAHRPRRWSCPRDSRRWSPASSVPLFLEGAPREPARSLCRRSA